MPFDRGAITFRVCQLPQPLPDDAIERFAQYAASPIEKTGLEPEFGWVTGRHLLDNEINEQTAILGGYLFLNLRYTERRVPPALLRAHCRMAELRFEAENGRAPKPKERREIRTQVYEALVPRMPPHIRGTPIVVDHKASLLYVGATAERQMEELFDAFRQAVGFEPIPITPEVWAIDAMGLNTDSLTRLNFSPEAPQTDESTPIGRDFLTWLWYLQEEGAPEGLPLKQHGNVAVAIDGPLVFVAPASAANESVVRKGVPTASAEAKAALLVGKKLKRARLALQREHSETWSVVIDADDFIFRSMKPPEGEALDPHSIFEERITCVYLFVEIFLGLFEYFLDQVRMPGTFSELQKRVQEWVVRREGR